MMKNVNMFSCQKAEHYFYLPLDLPRLISDMTNLLQTIRCPICGDEAIDIHATEHVIMDDTQNEADVGFSDQSITQEISATASEPTEPSAPADSEKDDPTNTALPVDRTWKTITGTTEVDNTALEIMVDSTARVVHLLDLNRGRKTLTNAVNHRFLRQVVGKAIQANEYDIPESQKVLERILNAYTFYLYGTDNEIAIYHMESDTFRVIAPNDERAHESFVRKMR